LVLNIKIMIKSIWWLLGYPDELLEEADTRQKHLKHMVCKQIKESKLNLKKVDKALLQYELYRLNEEQICSKKVKVNSKKVKHNSVGDIVIKNKSPKYIL